MSAGELQTSRLVLVPNTLDDVRAQIAGMTAEEKVQLSSDWLAQLESPRADLWTFGFTVVDRALGIVIGTCGFKGPPNLDGIVEIAYGVSPEHQGNGYATEAAGALVAYAFSNSHVRGVRAHTYAAENASTRVLAKSGFRPVGEVLDPEDGLVWRWEKP